MRKFYNFLSFTWLVALAILMSTGGVHAQLAPQYPLTISSGTYSSISGSGTSVTTGNDVGTNITGLPGFTVNGVSYTNARMGSNGWLALYTSSAPTTNTSYNPLSTAMTNGAVIFAPYGRDLNTDANSGTAWWQQVGNELVFEWKNFNRYAYTDVLNFQIRLNTSTGEIKFVYGTMTPAANTTYPQVGWKTNGTVAANWSTDINNVMIDVTGSPNTCNWSNVVTGNTNASTCYFNSANSGVVPASGLTYSWTKPNGTDPNPVRTFSAVSSITTSAATLTWTAPTGATQYNVQYRAMGSCTWTNFSGNPVSSATATLTGLSPATTYQIRVQSGNGSVNGLWSHIPNQAGTGNGYVAAGTFTTLANACAGTPAPGNTVSSANPVCSGVNFTLSLQNPPTETGITYQWQSADDAAFTIGVTNLGTASTQTTSQTTAKYYRCNVTCTNSGLSAYSTALQVTMSLPTYATYNNVSYTESFESWVNGCSTSDRPSAAWENSPNTGNASWRRNDQGSTAGWTSPTYGVYSPVFTDGSYSARFHSSYATGGAKGSLSLYVNMTAATGNTRLSFDHINTDGTDVLKVFLSTDGGVTFTQQGTDIGISAVWTNKTFDFNSTSATTVIKLEATSDYGSTDIGIDKLKLEPVPSCLPTTATAASNITATTASANWSTATGSWIIEYGPTATFGTPGTGATAGNGNNTVVTASNMSTIGLTGLTASTGYSYVVRQDCSGSGNGYSANSNVITFTTSQIPATLPYTQNFASNDFGFVNGSQTNQWAYGTATGNPANAIYVSNDGGTTNNYNTGAASVVHAYRDITIPSGSTLANFSFDWKANGESCCDYLRVWLVPTSYTPTAGSQITVDPSRIQVGGNLNQQSSWQTYSNNALDVSSFAGQTMRLVFEWRNDGSVGTNPPAAVDNINIAVPTCPATTATAASNITATTASANWSTATGSWIIEYGPTATFGTPGTGATAGNVNNTVVTASNVSTIGLTGLTASTGYSYVVRQDCSGSGNGYSANSNVITFTTACLPASIPFSEGFESGYTDQTAVGGCWSQQSMAGAAVWTANNTLTTYNRAPRTGGWNAYLQYSNTDWLFYPVTLAGGTAYKFSVYARQDGATATNASITLAYGSSASDAGMTNTVVNAQGIVNGNYQEVAGVFTPSASGTYYIGIKGVINGSPWYISLDDISVTLAPTDAMDWCNLQFPSTGAIQTGGNLTVYTRGYEPGVTDAGGQGAGITVWVGTSSTNSDPAGGGWTWTAATYNVDALNNDEYQAAIGSNLAPGTYYYASRWQLNGGPFKYGGYSSGGGGFWNGTTYVSGVLTVNPIPNDDAPGAISLTVGSACGGADYSNYGATSNVLEPTGITTNTYATVWYKFTAPASGAVRVSTDYDVSGTLTDTRIALYEATDVNDYSTFTALSGDEDGGVELSGYASIAYATGLTSGATYYIQVDKYSSFTSSGTFCITVDELTSAMLATGTCADGTQSILGSNTAYVGWVNMLDIDGKLIMQVRKSTGVAPSAFNTTRVNIHSGGVRQDAAGKYYLDRNYSASTAQSGPFDIKLYFLGSERADLAVVDAAAGTLANLNVTHDPGATCNIPQGHNNALLTQTSSGSANGAEWVQVTTPSFSGFFINTGNNPLPVNLLDFTARATREGMVELNWIVAEEKGMKEYVVERSTDGRNFIAIGTVSAVQKKDYALTDNRPVSAVNYYRLKMVDRDGAFKYSEVRQVVFSNGRLLSLYPNPTSGHVYVSGLEGVKDAAYVNIYNEMGMSIYSGKIGGDQLASGGIDMSKYAPGAYMIRVISDEVNTTMRFVKE